MFNKKLVSSLCVIALTIAIPSMANAGYFVGGRSYKLTGTYQPVQGVRATITCPSSFPTISAGNSTSAWVCIGNYDTMAISQVGFATELYASMTNPHFFYGEIPPGGSYGEYDAPTGPSANGSYTFKIQKENGHWIAYIGSTKFYDSTTAIAPNCVQYFNENNISGLPFYGTQDSKLTYSNVQYWNGSSGSNSSTWVWEKPTLQFLNQDGSSINTMGWGYGSWQSWR